MIWTLLFSVIYFVWTITSLHAVAPFQLPDNGIMVAIITAIIYNFKSSEFWAQWHVNKRMVMSWC